MNTQYCFHCNEPVPVGVNHHVVIDGIAQPMCCSGCEAVARLIIDADLKDFYEFRSEVSARVEAPESDLHWRSFDAPTVLDNYAPKNADGLREIRLRLDDMRCAACSWLIEKTVADRDGVSAMQVDVVAARARLRWNPDEVKLSELLARLDQLGFRPHPLRPDEQDQRALQQRRSWLRRLAVAGLGMMQVMMYAMAMYIGAIEPGSIDSGAGMDPDIWQFLRAVSLLIATPVVFYSAAPFFLAAWQDLRRLRTGMDVPVAIAIGSAYAASTWHVFAGQGEVYFDAVTMFVFFLLLGRFLEFSARRDVAASSEALLAALPATATRLSNDDSMQTIALAELQPGYRVIVGKGDVVPADGELVNARAILDESLLTGEAHPVERRSGDIVAAGTINQGAPLQLTVTRTGRDTLLSGIARLLEEAQLSRPRIATLADRVARHFVAGLLVCATIVALAWSQLDPSRAFDITLAVLVVTCPCALALAVPVALASATGSLATHGVLTVHGDALERLPDITDVVFDKTGTLTVGRPQLSRIIVTGSLPRDRCLSLAHGLEAAANHPLSAAFANTTDSPIFSDVEQVTAAGMKGCHSGNAYRIGTPAFALDDPAAPTAPPGFEGDWIVLADDGGALAWFELEDMLKPEAIDVVHALQARGITAHIASGDGEATVHAVAQRLGIDNALARQLPEDKLALIRELQARGRRVLMTGDGLNDAPVLGGADVSMAMSHGTALAQAGADFIINGSLGAIPLAMNHARRTRRIMRQNIAWAIGYNLLALPLAAAGMIAPWAAAIGMSLSSLLVTLNAARLRKVRIAPVNTQDVPAIAAWEAH